MSEQERDRLVDLVDQRYLSTSQRLHELEERVERAISLLYLVLFLLIAPLVVGILAWLSANPFQ